MTGPRNDPSRVELPLWGWGPGEKIWERGDGGPGRRPGAAEKRLWSEAFTGGKRRWDGGHKPGGRGGWGRPWRPGLISWRVVAPVAGGGGIWFGLALGGTGGGAFRPLPEAGWKGWPPFAAFREGLPVDPAGRANPDQPVACPGGAPVRARYRDSGTPP